MVLIGNYTQMRMFLPFYGQNLWTNLRRYLCLLTKVLLFFQTVFSFFVVSISWACVIYLRSQFQISA